MFKRQWQRGCLLLGLAGDAPAGDSSPVRLAGGFGRGFRFCGVCPYVVDPSVDNGEQTLDTAAGQLAEGNIGALAGQRVIGLKAWDAKRMQVRCQTHASLIAVVGGCRAHRPEPDLEQGTTAPW